MQVEGGAQAEGMVLSEREQVVVYFDVMCVYLKRVGAHTLQLLRATRSRKLNQHEENLCIEL